MTVCLHTHRPTTGALGEAGNVGPRKMGRPEAALALAFATALLSELLRPPNFHNSVILDRGTLPHKGQESKTERHDAKEGRGHENTDDGVLIAFEKQRCTID